MKQHTTRSHHHPLLLLSFLSLLSFTIANDCNERLSCQECTTTTACVWCEGDGFCTEGNPWGADDTCSGFRWRQCRVPGMFPFIAILCAIALVLLITIFFVCRSFCCQSRRKKESSKYDIDYTRYEDDDDDGSSSTPKTDARREEMAKKYGFSSKTKDKEIWDR
eukprot:TRINITY_DN6533_c0_g1_i1.p1 TRINITY_DN6533_c0_g1~~TRINITY_DN6533_c0_g1_i1.p1  ORF type:complete len:164 (+),score=30.07 TRINITY_DN6533_c0_g1_i1:2-493(+)